MYNTLRTYLRMHTTRRPSSYSYLRAQKAEGSRPFISSIFNARSDPVILKNLKGGSLGLSLWRWRKYVRGLYVRDFPRPSLGGRRSGFFVTFFAQSRSTLVDLLSINL